MSDSRGVAAHYDALYTAGDFARSPRLAAAIAAQIARHLAGPIRSGGLFVFVGTSALRPRPEPAPSWYWYWHTLPAFRAFLGALGMLWTRTTRRPGVVLGIVRVGENRAEG